MRMKEKEKKIERVKESEERDYERTREKRERVPILLEYQTPSNKSRSL